VSMYSREQIQRMALKGTGIDFLKSEAVANAVAERFKKHLGKHIPPGTLYVGVSVRHPGTWQVRMQISSHVPVSYVNNVINHEEASRVAAAFRAVFRPEDVVTTWTRPPRKR
jgi:hypothetical protein